MSVSNAQFNFRRARWTLLSAAALLTGVVAGCGGGSAPMLYMNLKVASITQNGGCEDVNVKVIPVSLEANAPQLSNKAEFLTPVKLAKGADGVSCVGEAMTRPMAPGKWKFMVALPSDTSTCEHDVAAGGVMEVNFKDGETACK